MDRLDVMRLYTRIVDRRSFTLAAQDLEVPRSTATQVIKELETRLGVRLLQRTTRSVRSTLDGEAYYQRCVAILERLRTRSPPFEMQNPAGCSVSTCMAHWRGTSCCRRCLRSWLSTPIFNCR